MNSERSDKCIDFTMIITSRNNASISNFGDCFRCQNQIFTKSVENAKICKIENTTLSFPSIIRTPFNNCYYIHHMTEFSCNGLNVPIIDRERRSSVLTNLNENYSFSRILKSRNKIKQETQTWEKEREQWHKLIITFEIYYGWRESLFKIVTRAIEDLLGLLDFSYGIRLTDYFYSKQIYEVLSLRLSDNC
ncbi:hypothetical protein AGLY_006427 [Aphis glycines]|uniref:Uncharacterized protein n=1 Tax=Aphis glycines TaxID=307491 RepID=A0A6G0TR45_APHGL|nr:hypothetical protein AGLY_006427 [Aphis glycines]